RLVIRHGWRSWGRQVLGFAAKAPDALDKTPAALRPGIGPFDVALGRGIRKHEPTNRVGAILGNDRLGRDHILLGFGHLFRSANLDLLARIALEGLAVALFDLI